VGEHGGCTRSKARLLLHDWVPVAYLNSVLLPFGGSGRGFACRILFMADDVCYEGNMLPDTKEIDMLVVFGIENSSNNCVKSTTS